MNSFFEAATTIALAVIGLGVVSVVVSRNAQTPAVIQSAASGLANNIGVAESPVTGNRVQLTTGYPASNSLSLGFGS